MNDSETVRVDLGDRSYDIIIGDGVLLQAGNLLAERFGLSRPIVVTDEQVAKFHLNTLQHAFGEAGMEFDTVVLPPGEQVIQTSHLVIVLQQPLA